MNKEQIDVAINELWQAAQLEETHDVGYKKQSKEHDKKLEQAREAAHWIVNY